MIVWRVLILFLVIICASFNVEAKKQKNHPVEPRPTIYGKQNLVTEINRILQNIDPKAAVGIHIKSMKQGDSIYTKNEQHSFIPASIVKILTAEAALLYLGPEYKFPTTLLTDGKQMPNGMIQGNLYLVQSGDPSLTYYDLTDLMVTLKSQQIQGITGNVYIDNTSYDQNNFGPGWDDDDKQYCWSAPINASIINRNCVSFKIAPAKAAGQLAYIVPNPRYYYGNIQNSVMTKQGKSKSCYVQLLNQGGPEISIGGCMAKGREPLGVSAVVPDVMGFNKSLMQNLFKRYGIRVDGAVLPGQAKRNLTTIAFHQSKPLHELVNEMLKKSDNVIAGTLLKKMGAFYSRHPGSWQNGNEAVKQILAKKAGLDPTGLIVIDGSGLSLHNRLKPSQMMQVLDFAYHHYGTNYEFISSLPIAGRDGTLKNRLRNVSRKVRAKTGTMARTGVVSLAGYAVTKDKEPMAFVIIFNGQNGNAWRYREAEDKIVTAITNYSRG